MHFAPVKDQLDAKFVMHVEKVPFLTCIPDGHLQRVTIPDAV